MRPERQNEQSSHKRDKNASFWDEIPDLETLIVQQGVKPFHWEEWQKKPAVWPQDENVEDFITWLRETRQEGSSQEAA